MSKILSEGFLEELNNVLDYLILNEHNSFLESDIPNDHIYQSALVLKGYLGEVELTAEEAHQLMKTDCRDNVMTGTEIDGWTEADEDDFNEDEDGTITSSAGVEFRLWI
jgi:hypothetical protein